MTREQYDRWKDFALRMARTCFKRSRRPSESWIVEQVESWFWWRDFQKDWGNYSSWDQDKFPLCDHIKEFYEDEYPGYTDCRACCHDCTYDDDCPGCKLPCKCDDVEEAAYNQFSEQWMSPVLCCIRAGIDFACQPSTGVLGFTAGDLRAMYPEGVPDWVSGGDEKWCPWLDKNHDEEQCRTFSEMTDDVAIVL